MRGEHNTGCEVAACVLLSARFSHFQHASTYASAALQLHRVLDSDFWQQQLLADLSR